MTSRGRKGRREVQGPKKKAVQVLAISIQSETVVYQESKPVLQITCKCDQCDRHHFSTMISMVWVLAPFRPVQHEILLLNMPQNLSLIVIHPRD